MQLLALAGLLLLRAMQALLDKRLHRGALVDRISFAASDMVCADGAHHGAVRWSSTRRAIATNSIYFLEAVEALLFKNKELLGCVRARTALAVERGLHLLDAVHVVLRMMDRTVLLLALIKQLHHLFVLGAEARQI